MSLLPSEKDSIRRKNVWVDYISIHEIPEKRVRDLILRTVRKWGDSLENFGQYVIRRLQKLGILCEFSSNISPVPEGYHISITIRVKGISKDLVKKHLSEISRTAGDRTLSSKEYRKFEGGVSVE